MDMIETRASDSLYRGHLSAAAERLMQDGQIQFDRDDAPYSLAALCLSGRPQQAELILKEKAKLFTPEELVMCRYFLAVGYTLAGRQKRARRYILGNFGKRRICKDPKSQFYMWQGLAFYRYFCGRMRQGLQSSTVAYDFALMTDFAYGRMVAAEVKGHLLYHTGNYVDGMAALEHASNFAQSLQNGQVLKSVSLAQVTYESRMQNDVKKSSKKIREMIKALPHGDAFAESSLRLELARQFTAVGQLKQARLELNSISQLLFRQNHYRFEAILNIRYAEWHYANGDSWEALLHTENAVKILDENVDALVLVEALMRQARILKSLGQTEAFRQVRARIEQLSSKTGDFASQQFLVEPVVEEKPVNSMRTPRNINHRQVQILRYLETNEYIDVHTAKGMFTVSEITACRDLSSLTKKGYVQRIGKARATRYLKAATEIEAE
jgi:tetratricopeptide (TPR) repeat protein